MERSPLDAETPLSDEALICGFRIPAEGPARPISVGEVRAALESGEGVSWLHFRLSDARAERYLRDLDRLPGALRRLTRPPVGS
jgi:hypothetical protein